MFGSVASSLNDALWVPSVTSMEEVLCHTRVHHYINGGQITEIISK